MAARVTRSGETARHARLKRLAFLWAQAQGFSVCAMEVSLPKCRYRADVAACRPQPKQIGTTAIFECKQVLCDLRRENCRTDAARQRLEAICKRRQILETRLRAHYPSLRSADALFPEFDSQSFAAIGGLKSSPWAAQPDPNGRILPQYLLHRSTACLVDLTAIPFGQRTKARRPDWANFYFLRDSGTQHPNVRIALTLLL